MTIGQGIILYVFLIPMFLFIFIALIKSLIDNDKQNKSNKWELIKANRKINERLEKDEFLLKSKYKLV